MNEEESILDTILKVERLEKYYGNKGNITRAIDDISFQVEQGEFVGIMGASGSGKTTLLNCISTMDTVTEFNARKLSKFRRDQLGFIFQDFNLLDTLTAFENIALALTISKTPSRLINQKVAEISEKLLITGVLNKYPYQLSGGEKQRVACARAIVTSPAIVLADEPTGALDSKASRMLLESFETLNNELGSTILMVTHDAFTASYCHRILFIKDGKVFNELVRGDDGRKEFFRKIIEVVTLLGGDNGNVL